MKSIIIIIIKELRQIKRNKQMLGIIFGMPLMQLLILANAVTFEMKDIKIGIVDQDVSSISRQLVSKFEGSKYFVLNGWFHSEKEAEIALENGDCDLYLTIPNGFEKDLYRENKTTTFFAVNAIDGSKAGLASQYTSSVIADFNQDLIADNINHSTIAMNLNLMKNINIDYANWYNPDLNYKTFMVPGLLVLLVSMVSMFLGGMNLVREKELGTIEQLNVTPIRKDQLLIGKLLPFWFIAMFDLGFGLFVAKIVYNIPIVGSLPLLFLFAGVFITVVLGIGLLISTIADTQQQSMFLTWFFSLVFILLSGLFTAIENMPAWAQTVTYFNPLRYFMEAVRMILLKGAGFSDLSFNFAMLVVYGLAINALAVTLYKKTS